MKNSEIHFLTNIDIKYLEEQFDRRIRVKNEKNEEIFFNDFKDIVLNFYKFSKNQTSIYEKLEKIKKELKDGSSNEGELIICKSF